MARPVEFDAANAVYAADQPEYEPLHAHRTPTGRVTSCWELSAEELAIVQRTGRVYLTQLTFNNPLQPVFISATAEAMND